MTNNDISIALKPIERTLYPPIRDLLQNLGFKAIQEIRISEEKEQYIDILFSYEGITYILEIKIGDDLHNLVKGLVQIYGYSLEKKIENKIVILFPEDIRQYVNSIDELTKKIKYRSCRSLFLTTSWWDLVDLSIDEALNELKSRIDKRLSSSKKIEVVSCLLESSIKSLAKLINMHYKDRILLDDTLNYLTRDQGLFLQLSYRDKNKGKVSKKLQREIISLLAYILVNQILFYFLYSKKTKKVAEIKEIKNLSDLYYYFNQIKKIDFRPIFDIDVISRIPKTKEIIDHVNVIINSLSPLEVDEIKHDLYGRLIGKTMPEETRKTLASYYTKVSSAEILSHLTIDRWDEKVWDTACGSGTILVSAYSKKLELFEKEKGLKITVADKDKLHKEFLEKQITGTDIMPFACHLTGLNLSAQNLHVETDFIRVSNKNSLELIGLSKKIEVKEAYEDISNAIGAIKDYQKYLEDFLKGSPKNKKDIGGEIKKFLLEKPDVILINPPFTALQNLPEVFRKSFSKKAIIDICGKEINLWGYFLAHSDLVLKNGGKLGAIIPITFFRGKRTKKIREYILKNYSIEYIIRPPLNSCFSEDSNFNDIILIAKKVPFEENHETKLVFIHKSIDSNPEDIKPLIKQIKTELKEKIDTEDYSLRKIKQKTLFQNRSNLMPFFFSNKISIQDDINSVFDKIRSNPTMVKMDPNRMEDGLQLRGSVKPKESVITRKLSDNRILRGKYYFIHDDNDKFLVYYDKKKNKHKITKKSLIKTFRTITDVRTFDISEKYDYHITKKKIDKNSSNLIIPNRFILNSDNTFSTAFFTNEKIIPLNQFTMYMCKTIEESKLLCLYFQSIFFISQILRLSKKSMNKGGFADFIELKQEDLKEIFIPDIESIKKEKITKALDYFNKIKNEEQQPIIKQLSEKSDSRIDLDLFINETLDLGFSKNEIVHMYDIILGELKNQ